MLGRPGRPVGPCSSITYTTSISVWYNLNFIDLKLISGQVSPLGTKGYPWWRLYTQQWSETLAEETPRGLPVEPTQKMSTSTCQENVYPVKVPSFWDNHGFAARNRRMGPFNHLG